MSAALATQSGRILDAVQSILLHGMPPSQPDENEKKRRYLCYDALNDKYTVCMEYKKDSILPPSSGPKQCVNVSGKLPKVLDPLVLSYKLKNPVIVDSVTKG
jgi:hypothetical protein